MKIRSLALATYSAVLLGSSSAFAATPFVGTYDWGAAADGNVASFSYNGTAVENLTFGNAIKTGITTSSSGGNFRGSGWSTGATTGSDTFVGSIDLGKYIEFTLTVDAGYTLDLESITFGVGRSATGPRQWEWRSSLDGYAATTGDYDTVNAGLSQSSGVLTNPDTNNSWTGNVLDLSGSEFQDLTTITFRIYAYNSEASGGTGGLQGPLSFAGAVVPEPSITLLGVFGLLGLLRRRR